MAKDFLTWHPSSANGKKLFEKRVFFREMMMNAPGKAFEILNKDYRFGSISEVWDDFIFSNCVAPVLEKNSELDLTTAINRYSLIDHLLFNSYIRREEDSVRFRRAFWNVNVFGQYLSARLQKKLKPLEAASYYHHGHNQGKYKIAFILKGPYMLAHVEFLHSFLKGAAIFQHLVDIHLVLIDEPASKIKDLNNIKVTSLLQANDTYSRLVSYYKYMQVHQFDHICWVACVQNLTLYMGMQLAPVQSYWSMKYHSIIMPTLQKYAGLGFGGKSFKFDEADWFRGRAFPELGVNNVKPSRLLKLKSNQNIPRDSILIGCFVRAEKLYDKKFWDSIVSIISSDERAHFVLASQSMPQELDSFLKAQPDVYGRFHSLGWVNTKEWAFNLDIYYDSAPRGSCNTIFEAILAGVPILMSDSDHNKESSALPYLTSAASASQLGSVPGVFQDETKRARRCVELIKDSNRRIALASSQLKLVLSLQGQRHLFAKDYLNYFLGTNFQLKDLQNA